MPFGGERFSSWLGTDKAELLGFGYEESSQKNTVLMAWPLMQCVQRCCEIVTLYTTEICHSYWFNKTPTDKQPGRKYRWGNETKNSGKSKDKDITTSQMQTKQDENASLKKGNKPHG